MTVCTFRSERDGRVSVSLKALVLCFAPSIGSALKSATSEWSTCAVPTGPCHSRGSRSTDVPFLPCRSARADQGSRLYADRGYDFDKYRRLPWKRGIKPLIARRGAAHGSGLGKLRWVVERAFAWLHTSSKRLRIRYERRADLHQGLLQLACSIICL
ncbi:transposase [Streptomyces sp. NPDC048448]|uniref:transposase n=1 Tax=Streptomyces sp. NPDC048448 TaxID=3365554 RepID=UPI00371E661A